MIIHINVILPTPAFDNFNILIFCKNEDRKASKTFFQIPTKWNVQNSQEARRHSIYNRYIFAMKLIKLFRSYVNMSAAASFNYHKQAVDLKIRPSLPVLTTGK